MILPEDFISEMETRWTDTLGNVSSPALRRVWKQLANTFGSHIMSHGKTEGRQWHILQPPTGSGKSQGTIVYCSMLSGGGYVPEARHPGALVVTRLIADADAMAEQINEHAGKQVAVAYHSESKNKVKLGDLSDWPVVIITHRAYEIALDVMGKDGGIEGTWPWFHDWRDGTRGLVVIDESLDIVEHSQAGLDGLRQTAGYIPTRIRNEYPYQMEALEAAIGWLDSMQLATSTNPNLNKEKMMPDASNMQHLLNVPDMVPLRQALKGVRFDADDRRNEHQWRQHDTRLRSLHYIFRSWSYYAANKAEGNHTMNTARLLVPENVKGAVVLDATASSSVIYEVFNEATVLSPPPGSRSYQNVTMHISKGHKTGKRYMGNNAKKLAAELMADLRERFGKGRKVFIVTHKFVEPYLQGFTVPFEYTTGHWGAVDGSNQWRDCDTVVVFGLHHRPNTWPVNVFMAAQGPQSTDWLRESNSRTFGKHQDIRSAISSGQLVVDTVQAINRIRCRKVVDVDGNCPQAEVYIMLPNGASGDELQAGIEREMPGLCVDEDWKVNVAKRQIRRSKHDEPLKAWLKSAGTGSWSAAKVRNMLVIPQTTWSKFTANFKDSSTELYTAMTEAGFQYNVKGAGRGVRAYLESF